MNLRAIGFCLYLLTATVLLCSCGRPRPNQYQNTQSVALEEPSEEADRLWNAAQQVLRENRYRIDRVDRRAGIISSYPESSQHFFEFWRHDAHTAADYWESTVNPIRRRIEVAFSKEDGGRWTEVSVAVHKERLSSPDRQFNNSGAAYQFFGYHLPSTSGNPVIRPDEERWLPMGRDLATGEYILGEIMVLVGLSRGAIE